MNREEILKEIDEAMSMLKETRRKVNGAFSHARNIVVRNGDDVEGYNKGLEDAWKLGKKIADTLSTSERAKIFGYVVNGITVTDILRDFTPQEALDKLEAYERKQAEIKIGDVVTFDTGGIKFVCTKDNVNNDYTKCHLMASDGSVWEECDKEKLQKTGKHIDISSILEQIGGTE